tara:strand:- start:1006 stop:1206 length:201 start_codon:yes stop_codon:yes gene_type:complete
VTKNKFSDCISELTEVWWNWMISDNYARDHLVDFSKRKKHAEKCEDLINEEYIILNKLNNFFEENI